MNIRGRQQDKCIDKWGDKMWHRKLMQRKADGEMYYQIMFVDDNKIEQYERDGWELCGFEK